MVANHRYNLLASDDQEKYAKHVPEYYHLLWNQQLSTNTPWITYKQ
jgi:hypothetical protein